MPSLRTAYGYLVLACLLTFLFGLQPTAVLSAFLAMSFAAAGVLSIPRITYPKVLLWLSVIGILPASIIYFLSYSPYLCLAALSIVPATALLVLTIRNHQSRSAGIFYATLTLTIMLLAVILWWLYDKYGGLSIDLFKSFYNKGAAEFSKQIMPMLDFDNQALLLTTIEPQEYVASLYEYLILLTPSLFIMIIWVGVWLSTVIIRWIFMNYVYGANRFSNWPVTANRPLAWIYIIVFLLASLINPFNDAKIFLIIAAACNNLYIILMPTFMIIGCRTIKERMLKAPGCGCMTFMLLIMCLFALFMLPSLLAFTGAFRTITPDRVPLNWQRPSDDSQNPPDEGGNT